MDYMALIRERKSIRAYKDKKVPEKLLDEIRDYFTAAMRLRPEIAVEMHLFDNDVKDGLEGAAGYKGVMIGAPRYLVILSDKTGPYLENAGYIGEDMVLKITELGLASCWIACRDSDKLKRALGLETDKEAVAIIAFGYRERESKIINLYIKSMSDVDATIRKGYELPRMTVDELVSVNRWGGHPNYSLADMGQTALYEAFQAVCLAPTYRNRQPYGMVFDHGAVALVIREDEYTDKTNARLNAGVIMQHFAAVMTPICEGFRWEMGAPDKDYGLPPGHAVVATCKV